MRRNLQWSSPNLKHTVMHSPLGDGGRSSRPEKPILYEYSNAAAVAGKAFSIGRNGVITRLLRADGRAMLHPSKHINIITVKIPSSILYSLHAMWPAFTLSAFSSLYLYSWLI